MGRISFRYRQLAITLPFPLLVLACDGGGTAPPRLEWPSVASVKKESWDNLAKKSIFFGHQSVGANIVEGLGEVIKQSSLPLHLRIVELKGPTASLEKGVFAHAYVGANENPGSKDAAFAGYVRGGLGSSADIAFFKYCYIDLVEGSDPDAVFEHYRATMANVAKAYPKVTFVHVTVPLRIVQTGWKARLKRILGKPAGGQLDNVVRSKFNARLRQEYEGKAPVFDLAAVESTYPDGHRAFFTRDGQTYLAMVPEYTPDAGHLNAEGRRRVAGALLVFLADLASKTR